MGVSYWSVFDAEVIGPIAYSVCYIILALFLLIRCYQTEFSIKVIINPAIQIILLICFIEITLSVHDTIVKAVVFGIVFFIALVLQAPVYWILVHEYVPKIVIAICAFLIGSVIVVIAVLGYVYHVLSSFEIFTTIMCLIFLAFFIAAFGIFLHKIKNL